jgi:murein DD-endopeptidase MepM/ murein hydrolase activator NlpD
VGWIFCVVWSQRSTATGKGQLNASIGGRSLKRTFPYKVKSAAASQLQNEVLQEISKQGHQQHGNMACCQAATIGLAALSTMGLPSILLSGGDRAVAAEPPAIDLSQEKAIGTYAFQQIDVASEAKTPKGLLLEKLTREYVEDAINSAENPKAIVRNSSTVLLVGQQQENPSFHSIELEPKLKKITRATMPDRQPNPVSKFVGTGASTPLELGKDASSQRARQLNSQLELSEVPSFQKQLKTDLVGGYSPSGGESSMAEWRYEESESSSKSWETIGGKLSAKTFPEQSYSEEPGILEPVESIKVQAEPTIVNTTKQLQSEAIAELPKITTRVEGAVVIGSESAEASVSTVYEVRPGDTLAVIARRHGVSVEDLVKLNRLMDPNWLEVSQTLKIPQKGALALGEKTTKKVESPTIAKTPNESKDYGFTLPTSQRPQITDASYSTSAKGSVGEVKLASWQGGSYLAVETKQADSATELEEFGESNPRNVTPTATETVEKESEIARQDSANNSYSQRLRAEILRLRQQYEFERESQRNNNWDSEASGDLNNDSSGDGKILTPEVNSKNEYEFRQPEINSPSNREIFERLSPRRQEIDRPEFFPREEPNPADEPTVVGATADKAQEILNSSMGQMVSPELPPLEGADTYLPGGSMQFTGYIWPAKGTLTSGYGWRWGRMHQGIDIAAPTGTPIVAAAPGVISFAGWNSGYGYTVEIKHPDRSLTLYAHNSQILVQEGQTVGQGELIAKMGSTGRSTGPHLHFEIHPTGNGAVNPIAYLPSTQAFR